jgi:hypothetical protein
MNAWTSDVKVWIDPHVDGWHIETEISIEGQTFCDTYWHTWREQRISPVTVKEAIAKALVQLGMYINGYEYRRRKFAEVFDRCWRD